jgi:Ax21 family sulfation-dependent quorum factor
MNRKFLALALTAALPFGASAADLNYSYIEGGYTEVDLDFGPDADGLAVGGSAALSESIHMFGSYSSVDVTGIGGDLDLWRLGLGWNRGINDSNDLVVRANYVELDGPGGSVDGWEAEVGLRSALTQKFETYVGLGYFDGGDFDGETYGKLGAQYKFNQTWGLAASATFGDGADEYFIGPRISF